MNILEIPFVGAYELRKNLPILLQSLQKRDDGLVVTQKGKPAAVVLSVKKYLQLKTLNEELEEALRELANKDYILELIAAKNEILSGKGKRAKKVFAGLKI